MHKALRQIIGLTDRRTRIGLAWLGVAMLVGMAFEMASIGIFLPLFQLLLDPERTAALPIFSWLNANLAGGDPKLLTVLFTAALFGLFVVKMVVLAVITYVHNRFVFARQAEFARAMLAAYLVRPYLFHLEKNTAELIRNITTLSTRLFVRGWLPLLQIATEALTVAGVMIILLLVDAPSTLAVSAVLGAGVAIFYGVLRRPLQRWGERTVRLDGDMLQALHQALGAIKAIKLGGLQKFFSSAFARTVDERARIMALAGTMPYLPRLFIETLAVGGLLVLIAIIVMIQNRDIASVLPTLGIFAVAVARLMPSFSRVISNLGMFRENTSGIAILYADIESGEKLAAIAASIAEANDEANAPGHVQTVRLDRVSFTYPGASEPALVDIDLEIPHGASVALVGRSGAGKTTLADVILGLLAPTSGRLLLDGRDAHEDLPSWQRRIGYVPQDIYLVDDTFRRNVALGIPDRRISEEQLRRALTEAHLDDVVAGLPLGLDTVVGERGARLSGGQRQRVGIARALYHDPDVLVFDEATSALDNETEQTIIESLGALAGAKTMIVIAHRLSTVRHCDRLVFLNKGRILDQGTFDELVARNPDFRRMAALEGADGERPSPRG